MDIETQIGETTEYDKNKKLKKYGVNMSNGKGEAYDSAEYSSTLTVLYPVFHERRQT